MDEEHSHLLCHKKMVLWRRQLSDRSRQILMYVVRWVLSNSSLLHPEPIYCVFSKSERGQTTSNCASLCVSLPRPPSKWQRRFGSETVPFRGYLFVSQLNRTRMLSGRGRTRCERELWIHRANTLLFIQSSWSSPASKHWGFLFQTHLKRFDHCIAPRHR